MQEHISSELPDETVFGNEPGSKTEIIDLVQGQDQGFYCRIQEIGDEKNSYIGKDQKFDCLAYSNAESGRTGIFFSISSVVHDLRIMPEGVYFNRPSFF